MSAIAPARTIASVEFVGASFLAAALIQNFFAFRVQFYCPSVAAIEIAVSGVSRSDINPLGAP
jgi:hypothetical protein